MEKMTDAQIIERVKNGYIDDFSLLMNRHIKGVTTFVKIRLKDSFIVDDIVQNTFVKFYKAINTFDVKKQARPYLIEIAKNEMKMYFRSKKNVISLKETIGKVDKHDAFDLRNFIEGLPSKPKNILKLLYAGYTYEEIAKRMKASVNTIKTTIRRLRMKNEKR